MMRRKVSKDVRPKQDISSGHIIRRAIENYVVLFGVRFQPEKWLSLTLEWLSLILVFCLQSLEMKQAFVPQDLDIWGVYQHLSLLSLSLFICSALMSIGKLCFADVALDEVEIDSEDLALDGRVDQIWDLGFDPRFLTRKMNILHWALAVAGRNHEVIFVDWLREIVPEAYSALLLQILRLLN